MLTFISIFTFSRCRFVCDWAFAIATTPLFATVALAVIITNAIALAFLHKGISAESALLIAQINFSCTVIFAAEMVFKLIAFGFSGYIADTFNIFDGFIVVLSVVDSIQSPFSTTGVSVFRLARVLRIIRVAQRWKSMQTIVQVVSLRLSAVCWTALLLAVACFVYCLVGLQLYGLVYVDVESSRVPARNFSSLHASFLTVFQLLVGESLDNIMYRTLADTTEWSFLYFASWLMLGQWIFLNMFLALLMDGFDENDPIMRQQVRLQTLTSQRFTSGATRVFFVSSSQERNDELRTAAILVKSVVEDVHRTEQVSAAESG
jgi:hypothetical protein